MLAAAQDAGLMRSPSFVHGLARWFPTHKMEPTANEPRRRRKAPDVETSTPPDLLTDDLRRRDPPQTPARSPDEKVAEEEDPVGGGFTPRADGGNDQHPIHDEDQEDTNTTPDDYEREIDRLDQAVRDRIR